MTTGAQALVLAVRDDRYAVPIAAVRQVVEPGVPARLPGAPAAVLGLINVRGRIVPVLDLALLLGLPTLTTVVGVAVVGTSRGVAGLASSAQPVGDRLGDDLGASTLRPAVRRHRVATGVATLLDVEELVRPVREPR